MTLRRISVVCADAATPDHTWVETYTEGAASYGFPVGHTDPAAWAHTLVQRYNDSLRPGERRRMVISTSITEVPVGEKIVFAHAWEKTNLVTIIKGGRSYDTARCTVCGATSKRFGVGGYTLDPRYKKFESCRPKVDPKVDR